MLPQPVVSLLPAVILLLQPNTARFATPGVNIGLFCSTPMVALSRAVQPKHAMEMLLLGEMISAQRAAEIGLINWHVEESELESFTLKIAGKDSSAFQSRQ